MPVVKALQTAHQALQNTSLMWKNMSVLSAIPNRIFIHDGDESFTFHELPQPVLKAWQILSIEPFRVGNPELTDEGRNPGHQES